MLAAASLKLNPPIQYSWIWLAIGLFLLLLIVTWYAVLFWLVRKRDIKTLAGLKPAPPPYDLNAIKAKYLQMIDECYANYQRGQTSKRGLHRGLSMVVRYFVYEVRHFPAPRLTLGDIKRAPYPHLSQVIEKYYANEFSQIEHGSPEQAVAVAKELVQQWV